MPRRDNAGPLCATEASWVGSMDLQQLGGGNVHGKSHFPKPETTGKSTAELSALQQSQECFLSSPHQARPRWMSGGGDATRHFAVHHACRAHDFTIRNLGHAEPLLGLAVGHATADLACLRRPVQRQREAERWQAELTFIGSYLDSARR